MIQNSSENQQKSFFFRNKISKFSFAQLDKTYLSNAMAWVKLFPIVVHDYYDQSKSKFIQIQ